MAFLGLTGPENQRKPEMDIVRDVKQKQDWLVYLSGRVCYDRRDRVSFLLMMQFYDLLIRESR